MSERKVLAKYYPPDFDPSLVGRSKRSKNDKSASRFATVRLMSPFSMKCTTCGEFIYRGRKFNARKEIPPDEKYLNIQIFRFYIRCTRCSGEIVFKTDPRNMDYTVERGAKRNVDPWKRGLGNGTADETDEQRLDRIEREMAMAEGAEHMQLEERDKMEELEAKTADAKREMAVADALDTIRVRNARFERAQREGVEVEVLVRGPEKEEEERRKREEQEDEEAAKRAFAWARKQELLEEEEAIVEEEEEDEDGMTTNGASSSGGGGEAKDAASTATVAGFVDTPAAAPIPPKPAVKRAAEEEAAPPTFEKRAKKPKKNYSALLGIKKKA